MALSSLTQIPRIMLATGWNTGAALMQRWFWSPPFVMPHYSYPDLSTIKMTWVLSFDRAEDVYDDMVKDHVWSNDAAQRVMADNLRKRGLIQSIKGNRATQRFNWSGLSLPDQHDLHVNFRKVGGYNMDDLTAALGHFSIYVTPLVGEVTQIGDLLYEVKISQVGFHVMDSYDFEGHQFLGRWDDEDNSVSMLHSVPGLDGDDDGDVENSDFREWRRSHNRGGDFLIYSDVKSIARNPPDSFLVL